MMTPCATCRQPFRPKSVKNRFCTRACQERARRAPIATRLAAPTLTAENPRPAMFGERRIWCRRQARCLDHAEAQGWPGFDCGACPVDDELSMDERRAVAYPRRGLSPLARAQDEASGAISNEVGGLRQRFRDLGWDRQSFGVNPWSPNRK